MKQCILNKVFCPVLQMIEYNLHIEKEHTKGISIQYTIARTGSILISMYICGQIQVKQTNIQIDYFYI